MKGFLVMVADIEECHPLLLAQVGEDRLESCQIYFTYKRGDVTKDDKSAVCKTCFEKLDHQLLKG
ncbi:hypothetical protein SDC9_152907 [bioreactor metagenome]|uniref:Uncharacterized protein n=1 Tax=bioreactor metagenome TaxID=1076179 RepID=A0A645EW51_9ZZZZ